jgi:hypothetical protein
MRQVNKLSRTRLRQRHCQWCGELFAPDPRTKGHQRYCSKPACQTKRQRLNEKTWRIKNPDDLNDQRELSRLWHATHPDYSSRRRLKYPGLLKVNRDDTRLRMRKMRSQRLFDKSKVILTELVEGQADKCYLTQGSRWLMMRLTKASPLSRLPFIGDNRLRLKRAVNRLPRGHLYDLSGVL